MSAFKTTCKALAAFLVLGTAAVQAKDYRFGIITPPTQLWTTLSGDFADELRQATDGEIDIKVFPAGQLGNEGAMLQQLQRGSLDFMLITGAELTNHVDAFNALLAPALVDSDQQAARFLATGEAPQKLLGQLEGTIGVKGLAYGMGGNTHLMTNFEADSLDDVKGKRVRITPAAANVSYSEILGAVPMAIPLPQVFDAFANRQVAAVETQFDGMHVVGLHERGETLFITNHSLSPSVVLVSMSTWREFSDEQRAQVKSAAQRLGERLLKQQAERNAAALEAMREHVTVKEVPRSYFDPIIKQWDAQWRDRAPVIDEMRAEAARFKSD